MAARPSTSRAARPATSRGDIGPPHDAFSDGDAQYTHSHQYYPEDEGEDEDEEDSDEEDVFAFLPPSAQQQSFPPSPAQSPLQSHIPPSHPPPQASLPAAPLHQYPQYDPTNVTYPTSPPPPFSSFADPLTFPPPTFIPPTSTRYIPEAGPSTTSVPFVGTVDSPSPPSTTELRDSHSFSIEDGFRLRKLGLSTAVTAATGFTTSSAPISLDYKQRSALFHEKRHPSTALSDLSTIDPELDSASIKCVHRSSLSSSHTKSSFCRMKFDFDTLQEEDSPYPEVRASVSNIDDPDMPVLTLRMWLIGLVLSLTARCVFSSSSHFVSAHLSLFFFLAVVVP
jgi:hypothetical protein